MNAHDLMGGYAAYTTPDAALEEIATTATQSNPISETIPGSLNYSFSITTTYTYAAV